MSARQLIHERWAQVPNSAAAYAAALHHAGFSPWSRIAEILDAAGFGRYTASNLSGAAKAWAKENVAPAAARQIRQHFRERRKKEKT